MFANRKKNLGFTLIETLVVLAIVGFLMAFLLPRLGLTGPAARVSAITDTVSDIVSASRSWRGLRRPFTGVSIKVLTDMLKLPSSMGDGVGQNPSQGNYTVAVHSDVSQFKVTVTNLDQAVCLNVRNNLIGSAISITCTSGVFAAIYM